ncbi:very short patch repair endonuclease [Acetobacter sp. AN02]|nr:very short patch repair endonuclease [Acetobacter sp. AN02]
MSGIRGKDTKPEILLRKALHAEGFRYRLHGRKLYSLQEKITRSENCSGSCRKMGVTVYRFW